MISREQMAKRRVALQLWGANDKWNDPLTEYPGADVDGPANAADVGGRIEGRTDLVVTEAGIERLEPFEMARQVFVHPAGCFTATGARDADSVVAFETLTLFIRGYAGEEHCLHAVKVQRFHDIGGSGEVIAIVGEQKFRHYTALPLPKNANECASSGWSTAYSSNGNPATAASQA